MSIYILQVFKPPIIVIRITKSIMARFLWGTTEANKKIHWTKWINVCKPFSDGGINIRSLSDMCEAFACKLWFSFRAQSSIWAEFLLHRYCKGKDPTVTIIYVSDSPSWKKMIQIRAKAQALIFWKLGEGVISFWFDNWTHLGPLHLLAQNSNLCTGLVSD